MFLNHIRLQSRRGAAPMIQRVAAVESESSGAVRRNCRNVPAFCAIGKARALRSRRTVVWGASKAMSSQYICVYSWA